MPTVDMEAGGGSSRSKRRMSDHRPTLMAGPNLTLEDLAGIFCDLEDASDRDFPNNTRARYHARSRGRQGHQRRAD